MRSANVDVIVPAYNPGPYIHETIKSILSQTHRDLRLILIDDGSGQQGSQVLKDISLSDSRIHLIVLPRNMGGGFARNAGLANSSSEFVAFCDSDDRWPPEKLERQLDFMRNADIEMTHTNMHRIKEGAITVQEASDKIDINQFLRETDLFCSSVLVRRSAIKDARFGEMRARHPFKFWCSVLSRGVVSIRTPDSYFFYLVRSDSVSASLIKMLPYTLAAYLLYAPSFWDAVRFIPHRFLFTKATRR